MGVSYRKSTKIGKNSRATLSKSGVSFSTGVKGARVSMNSKGKSRINLSIPGTGLRYTKTINASSGFIMIFIMGIVNISIWLLKVAFILLWWYLKFLVWLGYQIYLLCKKFVLWIIAKIRKDDTYCIEQTDYEVDAPVEYSDSDEIIDFDQTE